MSIFSERIFSRKYSPVIFFWIFFGGFSFKFIGKKISEKNVMKNPQKNTAFHFKLNKCQKEPPSIYILMVLYIIIWKKTRKRIFERKSAKEYSKENPRKNTRKKINEEYFCENLLWEKIDKGIKAFIAFNEALNNSSVRKTTDFSYGPA